MAKGDREWWRSGRPAGSNPTPRDLEGRPFASGRFRVCYKGRYLKGDMKNKPLVAKVFKKEFAQQADSHIDADERIQDKAIEILDRWNQMDKTKKEIYLSGRYVTAQIERWVPNFVKYNSNTGYARQEDVHGSWEDVAQAISHYSYHITNRVCLLCDVQGGAGWQDPERDDNVQRHNNGLFLTDPAINSTRAGKYGETDLGPDGIASFFDKHRCNQFCEDNWLWPKSHEIRFCRILEAKKNSSWTWEQKQAQSRFDAPPPMAGIAEDDDDYDYSDSDDRYYSSSDDGYY